LLTQFQTYPITSLVGLPVLHCQQWHIRLRNFEKDTWTHQIKGCLPLFVEKSWENYQQEYDCINQVYSWLDFIYHSISNQNHKLLIPSATIFGWVAEGILLAKMKMFLVPILILLTSTLSFSFAVARLPDSEGIYIYIYAHHTDVYMIF